MMAIGFVVTKTMSAFPTEYVITLMHWRADLVTTSGLVRTRLIRALPARNSVASNAPSHAPGVL